MVKNIRPGGSSSPGQFTIFNNTVFFTANDGSHGSELWKSDGTEAGTVLVKNIGVLGSGSPSSLTVVNETLFFSARDDFIGTQLWKSDGTESGTVMVKEIIPGGSIISDLTEVNGTLFFTLYDGFNGSNLWKSDGTETGTVMVRDITPSGSAFLNFLTDVNGILYFTVDDGINGVELWRSDGTSDGTVLVENIHPTGSSNPFELTNINGNLFFWADDGVAGIELWKLKTTSSLSFLADLDANIIINGPADIFWLGSVVSSAGDFNGDGLDDVAVASSTGNSSGTGGVVYIFFGRNTIGPVNFQSEADADVILRGQNGFEGFGTSVASAGDFNGDGLEDIIVGAPDAQNNNLASSGSAFIFFGRNPASQITLKADLDADVIIDGQDANDFAGNSVASAGDFNGDGLDDVIIGAVANDNNGVTHFGSAFIFFGRSPTTQLKLRTEADANIILNGQNELDFFGVIVSSAGDFNGDGLGDVIVSAQGDDNNGLPESGSVFIFFGQNPTSQITLTADADANVIIDSPTSNDQFGRATTSAGDFNGDGLGDVLITTFADNGNGINSAGRGYIYFGQNPASQIQFMADVGANIILEGQIENGIFGSNAASTGDFNGDGLDDVIVGQFDSHDGQISTAGSTFIFFGRETSSQLILQADINAEIIMDGTNPGDQFGASASPGSGTASAGDFNGDGLDDVIIGAFGHDNGTPGSNVGRAYVFFGKNTDLPIIHLFGDNPATVEAGSTFLPFGAVAQDFVDGDLTDSIVEGPLDVSTLGTKTVTYDVVNSRGFTDHKERIVHVVDTTPPTIDLIGNSPKLVEVGIPYTDLGATALDNLDGDITGNIIVGGLPINTSVLGTSIITYDVTDSSGNAAHAERTVTVIDIAPPVITVLGDNPATVEAGTPYTDAGATALDNMNGDLTANITVGGLPIDTSGPGSFTVTYDVTDSSGNTVHAERTVNVVDSTPPVLTIPGDVLIDSTDVLTTVDIGSASATDTIGVLSITNDAPAQFPIGLTVVTWTATDTSGNTATATQNIKIQEPILPVAQIHGDDPNDLFGLTVSSAGDFNGDGIEDAMVGASQATSNGEEFAGKVFIFYGRGTANPLDLLANADADVIIQGQNNSDQVGSSVASIGDFNGDGFGDVIVSATGRNSNGNTNSGSALIFFGRSSTNQLILNAETEANIILEGQSNFGWFGNSVASAGDFNGDGLDDVIVGAAFDTTNGVPNSGNAFIFFGQTPSSQIVLNADTNSNVILDGRIPYDNFGQSVASAGDFNGDGLNDVIVGAYADGNQAGEQSGAAFIFFGQNPTGQINLSAGLDSNIILEGQNTWDAFGYSVDSAGDFNGDGLSDVIVGAVLDDNNGKIDSGSAFIFFGQNPTSQLILLADANADVILDGQSADDRFGSGISSAGDFNDDGFDDVIVGLANNASTDRALIFFGQNTSTQLKLRANTGAGILLSAINSGSNFGTSAASAGDFNGDGIEDVIVGDFGNAYIFPGNNPDAPTITVLGDNPAIINSGSIYTDAGATASDVEDGDITANIVVSGLPVNTSALDSHTITYRATDSSGNSAQAVRTVKVVDTTPPVVTAPANVTAEATGTNDSWSLIGTATATDNASSCIPSPSDAPAAFPLGLTVVTWTATDTSGNAATATQNVTVQDTTPPVVTAPANVAIAEATGPTTPVAIGTATATDNSRHVASITSTMPPQRFRSGSQWSPGRQRIHQAIQELPRKM